MTVTQNDTDIVCSTREGCVGIEGTSNISTAIPYNSSVYCNGYGTCRLNTIVANINDKSSNNRVYCGATRSCYSSTIYYATRLYCTSGSDSWGGSCEEAQIYQTDNVYFTSLHSGKGAAIYSSGVGSLNVFLLSHLAAPNLEVFCEDGDFCTIECGVSGACNNDTIIRCLSTTSVNCDVICDESSGVDCPMVIATSTDPPFVQTTANPTIPTSLPTNQPTAVPSTLPTNVPSANPTGLPSNLPTSLHSLGPTTKPTELPSALPTNLPSLVPSVIPTISPTNATYGTSNGVFG